MRTFESIMRDGGANAVQQASRFFMRTDPVHQTLRAITDKLQQMNVPYAVVGGMAMVAHGYDRTTVDVDILLTPEGWANAIGQLEGLGYVRPFAGSKNLRDTATGVRIEFLLSGGFPGDGKPKPVDFPDPSNAAVDIDGIKYLGLAQLVELKIASGMTNPGRLKDLADVQQLIKALNLPAQFSDRLNPYVREKFAELWTGVQQDTSEF
jgi:hypothetical protein